MTGPAGWAVPTRLLCDCRQVVGVYMQSDGSLFFPGVVGADGTAVSVRCRGCGRVGTVDMAKLRHAIAEQRRTFRIG